MRKLTTRFTSYRLAKYQAETKKTLVDILNFENLDIGNILTLIYLGNPQIKKLDDSGREEAGKVLDEYLSVNNDNSLMSAYKDIVKEFDNDIKLFKSFGVSVDDIFKQLDEKIAENKDTVLDNNQD